MFDRIFGYKEKLFKIKSIYKFEYKLIEYVLSNLLAHVGRIKTPERLA